MPSDYVYTTSVADFYGTLVSANGDDADEIGFIWSETSHSQPADGTSPSNTSYEHSTDKSSPDAWGDGDGFMIEERDTYGNNNLKYSTTYYVRAYALNDKGYSYSSSEIQFTTPIVKNENTTINVSGSVQTLKTANAWILNPKQVNGSASLSITETSKTTPMKRVNIQGSGNINITETVRTSENTTIQAVAEVSGINEYSNVLTPDPITVNSDISGIENVKSVLSLDKITVSENLSIVEYNDVSINPTLIEADSTLNTISENSQAEETATIDVLSNLSIIEESKSVESTNILINANTDIDVTTEVLESSLITASASLLTLSEVSTGVENTQISVQENLDITDTGKGVENTLIKILADMDIVESGISKENTLINILANVSSIDDVPTVEDVLRLYADAVNVVQFDKEITTPISLERDID